MRIQLVAGVLGLLIVLSGCDGSGVAMKGGSDIFSKTVAYVPQACEGGGIATGDEVAVKEETELRSSPTRSSDRIVNEKATEILKETHYHDLDQTERLKELCRQKEWARVQVVEPDWLTEVVGWVPVSSLRQIQRDLSGTRSYVESDFAWDDETKGYKAQLVANVNKIVRENSRCETVDPGTLSLSGNRGNRSNPVFFITCNNPGGPFNVWFEPGDAAAGKRFTASSNIGQAASVLACERAAKDLANNPETVSFSRFMDVAFVPYPNGNSRLVSSFTAKNSFGVEGKFRIECFFEGQTISERNISRAID